MNIIINRTKNHETQDRSAAASNFSFNKRWGSWGIVTDLHSEDCTVDVVLNSGVVLKHVPVASKEWVISDKNNDAKKGFNTGERDLPPVKAWVFVLMPTFTFSDCFIAPISMLNIIEKNASEPFLQAGKENIKERITPGGWHITEDYITGSHKAVSPDEKTSLEIDYGNGEEAKENSALHLNIFENVKADIVAGNSCTLKIFDTEIVIKQGEMFIKPKETTIEIDGNATLKTSGNTTIEATGNVEVGAPKVKITGGSLEINGMATPNGSGPFCGLPNCLFTGAPHNGNTVSGT